jgi:hypothetical protein
MQGYACKYMCKDLLAQIYFLGEEDARALWSGGKEWGRDGAGKGWGSGWEAAMQAGLCKKVLFLALNGKWLFYIRRFIC